MSMAAYALVGGVVMSGGVHAGPCESFMCMAGKLQGGAGSSCDDAIHDIFSIVRWHHGHFLRSATSDARRAFLNQCPGTSDSGNASTVDAIIEQFGAVR